MTSLVNAKPSTFEEAEERMEASYDGRISIHHDVFENCA
jgi:hypothetical protein